MKWTIYLFAMATLISQSSIAQKPPLDEILNPDGCAEMSKSPECWEDWNHARPSQPDICLPRKMYCSVITYVVYNEYKRHECHGENGKFFDCTQLVADQYGQVVGLSVLVMRPYYDGCHVPGACGSRACMPSSIEEASLDASCFSTLLK